MTHSRVSFNNVIFLYRPKYGDIPDKKYISRQDLRDNVILLQPINNSGGGFLSPVEVQHMVRAKKSFGSTLWNVLSHNTIKEIWNKIIEVFLAYESNKKS